MHQLLKTCWLDDVYNILRDIGIRDTEQEKRLLEQVLNNYYTARDEAYTVQEETEFVIYCINNRQAILDEYYSYIM